jgi:glycosyltransferase involved in cell wall biosynthesis
MNNKHVLLIGPFPPPIGGDTVLTLNVSRSKYWGDHGITLNCINTSAGDRVRSLDEKLTSGDLMRGIRIFFELAMKLPRCGAVLLWANNRFIVTMGPVIMAWSRLFGRPIFVKVFGAYLARRIRRTPQPARQLALTALRTATRVYPETHALTHELVEEGWLPAPRVFMLPNFLPDGSFAETFTAKRFSGRCVFFGQIKREKGVFDIIEAIGGREGAACDFYGPVLDRDRNDFLASISRFPNLSYKGTVEPGAVSRAAAAYDVLLLPTYHDSEGYPAVILEAYAAGIPVVATNWLSIPEIVEDGVRGILVPVKAPERIREAIRRFASDEHLYESMCRNAFEYVRLFSEGAVLGGILIPQVTRALR